LFYAALLIKRVVTLLFLLAFANLAQGQVAKTAQDTAAVRPAKKINIKQADKGFYNKRSAKNRLIGNVIFEHEGALMYCDSAWLFSADNRLEAFQNVRINQGDTLNLWGDYLEYTGNTRQALVTGKVVKLKDKQMTLLTDRLNYNRNENTAYYTTGGRITNDENLLVSKKGYYNSATKMFFFKDSVRLTNPDYKINCDTLNYSSDSRIAYFLGPTTITSDSSYIYCENGQYNTVKDVAQFEENALIYDDHKYLTGDSIYYEKAREYGEAYGNVLIHDTIENYTIRGGYAEYVGLYDSAFVTLEPLYSVADDENDTLHIHGDTLYSIKTIDTLKQSFRLVKVFYKVKFYKNNVQGKCDSLSYSSLDSTIRMYNNPVIWDDSTQITGDTIYMLTKNNKPDTLKVFEHAFMLVQVDSVKDNQVSGKRMVGKFGKEELRKVFVNGNGQTIYYPKEEDGDYIGMNRSVCANLRIDLNDGEVKKIVFLKKPEGKLHPMGLIPQDRRKLDGYFPRFNERPKNKKDLFID
jgi:lipopolysaccharide export system protein LptA